MGSGKERRFYKGFLIVFIWMDGWIDAGWLSNLSLSSLLLFECLTLCPFIYSSIYPSIYLSIYLGRPAGWLAT
jgi:hypothetical protein